jgi:uncharacterized membrane protein
MPGQQPIPGMRELSAYHEEISIEEWRFQTPLLPPAVLRQYQELIPDFADRYMKAWEQQSRHRQRLETSVVATQSKTQLRGQWFTWGLGSLALVVAGVLGVAGEAAAAIAVVSIDFVSLGGIFIVARIRDRGDLQRKAEVVPEQPPAPTAARQLPKGQATRPRPRAPQQKRRKRGR